MTYVLGFRVARTVAVG